MSTADVHAAPVTNRDNTNSNPNDNNGNSTKNNNNDIPALPKIPILRRNSLTANPVFEKILGRSPLLEEVKSRTAQTQTPQTQTATTNPNSSVGFEQEGSRAINYRCLADTFATRPQTAARTSNGTDWTSSPSGAKLLKLEEVTLRLLDPGTGIKLKDRSKIFQVFKSSFYGSSLIDWLIPNCKLCGRSDAAKYAQSLLDYMYIISVDAQDQFKESFLYIFQTSFLWPTVPWKNLNIPYILYLIKRNRSTAKTAQLTFAETLRLEQLMKKYKNSRSEISRELKEQEKLCGRDKITIILQKTPALLLKEEKSFGERSFEEYLSQMSESELENFVEKRLAQLKASNHMKRISVFASSKSIVERILLYQPVDPFVNGTTRNPFISDDPDLGGHPPSKYDFNIWKKDITQLIASPTGLKLFENHLCGLPSPTSRYTLDLYMAIRALDETGTYSEFLTASIEVFNEFIAVGAPREVTALTFGIKNKLTGLFSAVRLQGGEYGNGVKVRESEAERSVARQIVAVDGGVFGKLKRQNTATDSSVNRYTWHPNSMGTDEKSKSATVFAVIPDVMNGAPEMLAGWRLPYDVFTSVTQHLIVAMSRDLAPRFWASAEMTEMASSLFAATAGITSAALDSSSVSTPGEVSETK
ncbi:Regulator of G-protein signaling 7 [Entophlyctis luteolus]|nr:Regulator of G-protein signaling 7 [Entophlyctis luteolus]